VQVFRDHRRLVSAVGLLVVLGFAFPAFLSAASALRSDSDTSVSDDVSALGDDYVRALRAGDPSRLAALAVPPGTMADDPVAVARSEISAFGPSARAGDATLEVVGRSDGDQQLLRVTFADGEVRTLLVVGGTRFAGYDLRLDDLTA
jgi:hypothetical protein